MIDGADSGPPVVRLDEQTVERLAHRVAELLDRGDPQPRRTREARWLSAAEVSQWWGVDREWVYEHADELGVLRLGTGPKPRLRFDPDEVTRRLARPPAAEPTRRPDTRRSRRLPADSGDLLAFRADPELSSTSNEDGRPGGVGAPPATAPKSKPSAR